MADSTQIINRLQEQIDSLIDQELPAEALDAVNQVLEAQSDPNLRAAILEMRGTIYYNADHLQAAWQDFQLALEFLEQGAEDHPLAGQIHCALGATYHALEQATETAQHWQLAIHHFEQSDPPLLVDIATIANNLGFLYKSAGDMDSAENCFLRALHVLHSELGQYDEQTATVFCNLGTLYQQAGFHEQSHEMHLTALGIRSKMLGRAHPDTAQSHNNLALALAASGDYDSAKPNFEDSLNSFAALGEQYAEDFETVRDNYSSFLRDIGESDLAEEVAARVM